MRRIRERTFDQLFLPIKNHLRENASYNGCEFETFGEELEFVKTKVAENKVVTVLDCDGDTYLVSGFHFVNRIGYLVLDKPYDFEFEVKLTW